MHLTLIIQEYSGLDQHLTIIFKERPLIAVLSLSATLPGSFQSKDVNGHNNAIASWRLVSIQSRQKSILHYVWAIIQWWAHTSKLSYSSKASHLLFLETRYTKNI